MKAKLVKESLNDIFKPKSEEELGDTYREMKQKTDEFMTKVFSDLHQDPKNPNIYRNSYGEWMFYNDLKNGYIVVSSDRVWTYFEKNITSKNNTINMLIKGWLKVNTNWPQLPVLRISLLKFDLLKENTDWPQLQTRTLGR